MNEEELKWLKEISTTTGISYSGDMTITTDFANKLIDYIKELEQLQQQNQKYKEVIDKVINDLNIIIDIVREQPLGSDCWIIDRLEANKSVLKEVK